jgi:hypothetical protein
MNIKFGNKVITTIVVFLWVGIFSIDASANPDQIKRLTYSGNNSVHFPWLSDDGKSMIYVLEANNGDSMTKSIRMMNIETGEETELFQDRKIFAPDPYKDISLLVGSKPPMLSGNGRVAVFALSLSRPGNILDHYLAVINADGSALKVHSFPIQSLLDKDWTGLEFKGNEWERISHYAVNADGSRVACVLKGHLGPIRYGNASAIILLDTKTGEQKSLLAPDYTEKGWKWAGYPSSPLMGGGWAFSMDAAGDNILFGAKSSDDPLDFDLYLADWEGNEIHRISDFKDRWFSQAEMSKDGEKIIFFYTGKKNRGIGTYLASKTDGYEFVYMESTYSPRVEFFDLSGTGKFILHKHIYDGLLLDTETGKEEIIYDKDTPGYVSGLVPMDFPRFPAFWGPHIMNQEGTRILLSGIPEGKSDPEIYLLILETEN